MREFGACRLTALEFGACLPAFEAAALSHTIRVPVAVVH
jgi:hypothetical protein